MSWAKSLREQFKEWEIEKERMESRYDKKVRLVESREDSARFWEKKLEEKETDLDNRESAVMSREFDLSTKEEELYSEAYKFRRDYCCDHKVRLIFVVFLFFIVVFRTVVMGKVLHPVHSVTSVGMRATDVDIL